MFYRTLSFGGKPMYLGGIDTISHIQERPGQVSSNDFVGCIQSVTINGRNLNLSAPINSYGIVDTCMRDPEVCQANNPCGEGATCIDSWDRAKCQCPNGLQAFDCDRAFAPISLTGSGYVEFEIGEKLRRHQLLPYLRNTRWRKRDTGTIKTMGLKFRTADASGILLYAASNSDYTLIQVSLKKIA